MSENHIKCLKKYLRFRNNHVEIWNDIFLNKKFKLDIECHGAKVVRKKRCKSKVEMNLTFASKIKINNKKNAQHRKKRFQNRGKVDCIYMQGKYM